MRRTYHYLVCTFVTFLPAVSPRPSVAGNLSVINGEIVVNVDAATNKGNAGFLLRNDANKPMEVLLHVDQLILQTTGKTVPAEFTFKAPDSEKTEPFLQKTLGPGKTLLARLEVSGFVEAGEAHAHLLNGSTSLATIRILKLSVSFGVSVDAADAAHPEVVFQRGRPGLLVFKNADPMTYPVRWSLMLSQVPVMLGRSSIVLPGQSTVPVGFTVPGDTFTSWFSGLFKDPPQEGHLLLRFDPPGDVQYPTAPMKTIPVKVRMRYWAPWIQNLAGTLGIVLVLLAGSVSSVLLSLWIPHKLRRIELIHRAEKLARKTKMISPRVDSSLRVGVRVERLRLTELIQQVGSLSADASTTLDGYKRDLDLLDRRVDVVKELDEAAEILASLRGKPADAPPTILDNVGKQLDEATATLKSPLPTEADLQRAQEAIRGAKDRLGKATDADSQLAGQLAKWVGELKGEYNPAGAVGTLAKCKELAPQVQTLLVPLKDDTYKDAANIRPEHYHWLSSAVERLFVLRGYVRAWEDAEAADRDQMKTREGELLECLRSRTWDALRCARRIRLEVEERTQPETVKEKLVTGAFSIHTFPLQPLPNEPVRLEVRLQSPWRGTCAALQEFTCVWDFGDVGNEEGWTIWHYFRSQKEAQFSVSFRGPDGNVIKSDDGKTEVTRSHRVPLRAQKNKSRSERRNLELVQFAVALGVALLGLIAGARQKLMELDVATALVGVFLIGFGVDTVKNLIAKRPQGGT